MFFLRLGVFLAGSVFLLIALTQVVVPIVRNRPLFPFFRRRGRLHSEITRARADVANAQLEVELRRLHHRAGEIRHPDALDTGEAGEATRSVEPHEGGDGNESQGSV